jgi:hypothetical protein
MGQSEPAKFEHWNGCGVKRGKPLHSGRTAMSIEPDDPLTAALLLADALEKHRISYAIGGALAYGLWGIPRATIDVTSHASTTRRAARDAPLLPTSAGASTLPACAVLSSFSGSWP